MNKQIDAVEYWANAQHVRNYLAKAHLLPHSSEGDKELLRQIPAGSRKILDLGTGNGHMIGLLRDRRLAREYVGLDVSVHMLAAAKERFRDDPDVEFIRHDLNYPISQLGQFDVVVTRFATHNLDRARQLKLYSEVFELLTPDGVFCNLEHVPAPTESLHRYFYEQLGSVADCFDDISSKPVSLETHLRWLQELEFAYVGCEWQWLEMALIVAAKGPVPGEAQVMAPSIPGSSGAVVVRDRRDNGRSRNGHQAALAG